MLKCLQRLPSRCCWTFPLHQGYSYIVYFDMIKVILTILYSASVFLRFELHPFEIILIVFILLFTLFEGIAAYFSLFKGFKTNNWRKHQIYFFLKVASLIIAIPAAIVVDQLACRHLIPREDNCFALNFFSECILLIIGIYFTWIVYSLYKKTRQGYYGPLGAKPCLAIMSKENVFTLNPKAVVIEVEGNVVKSKQKTTDKFGLKGIFYNDDVLAINSRMPTNVSDRELDELAVDTQMVVTIDIEGRIKKGYNSEYRTNNKPKVWIDKQVIRTEEVDLMNIK